LEADEREPLSGALADEVAALKAEMNKLRKAQLRAGVTLESTLSAIRQAIEEVKARLDQDNTNSFREDTTNGPMKDLLVVVDGLEEAIHAGAHRPQNGYTEAPVFDQAWLEGIEIIHRRVLQILEKNHIQPIPSVGHPFDPRLHMAADIQHRSDVAPNTIVEEQRKGYRCGDQVLRYAEVVVAKPVPSEERNGQNHRN
jgi:molecular chaperone GrpE